MYIFDASAILVYLLNEPGKEKIEQYLEQKIVISGVNWAEVIFKIRQLQVPGAEEVAISMADSMAFIATFTEYDLKATLQLPNIPGLNLSLADKVCLGTAVARKIPVVTADRVWKELKLPVEVICIR